MTPKPTNQCGPLPLVVGVTGHRNLREIDYPALEQMVREVFESLLKKYTHTSIILLSPLAEGADRLVARVALELDNVRLIVPMPMRKELYQEDFNKPGSFNEFNLLLSQAEQSFDLPILGGRDESEISEPGKARNRQYEGVGAYIARHSQILIALWDGHQSNLVGGTSSVVKFQREGVPEPYAPHRTALDLVESGPVHHIITPRNKNDHQTMGEPLTKVVLDPKGYAADEVSYDRIFENMDAFNCDALKLGPMLQEELAENIERLFPKAKARKLSKPLQDLRERYALADTLAIYFQGRTKRTLNGLYLLIALAAASFGAYGHVLHDWHVILLIYLAIIVIAHLWVHRRFRDRKDQNKYQDYRTLAEGMRVQFFWCLAGTSLPDFKLSVADHYLRKQKSELDWIRHAIRVWNIPEPINGQSRAPVDGQPDMNNLDLVLNHWVCDQANYFTDKQVKEHKKLASSEKWSKGMLWFGIGMTIAFALVYLGSHCFGYGFVEYMAKHKHIHGGLLLLMTLPPVGAALLHSYTEKTALSEHVKQYNRMSGLFTNAEKQLNDVLHTKHARDLHHGAHDAKITRELIEELGKEALAENGDWVLLHRERPVDPPQAV